MSKTYRKPKNDSTKVKKDTTYKAKPMTGTSRMLSKPLNDPSRYEEGGIIERIKNRGAKKVGKAPKKFKYK